MRNVVLEEVKILSNKYCKSEKYVLLLFKICKDLNYTNAKKEVENYLFSVSKGVSN